MSAGPVRHRRKALEIEAMEWDGTFEGAEPIVDWIRSAGWHASAWRNFSAVHFEFKDHPDSADRVSVGAGDWVVQDADGIFSTIDPATFAELFEAVSR